MKLSSMYLKKYLLHLRLPESSKTYADWAVEKDSDLKKQIESKPKEFEKALAGYEHNLSEMEINRSNLNIHLNT